jgi:hypothetical protein
MNRVASELNRPRQPGNYLTRKLNTLFVTPSDLTKLVIPPFNNTVLRD